MKLKVSTSPYTYFLLLMTIMDTGYFVLLNIPGLRDSGYVRMGLLVVATLLAMNCYINKNIYRTLRPYYNYLNVFVLYLAAFYVVHFIYGMVHYTQKITSIISVSSYLGMFLLIYLFLYVFQIDGGYDRILKPLSWITYPYMLVITLRAVVYNLAGRDLMPYLGQLSRSGRLRYGIPALCGVLFLYYFYKLLRRDTLIRRRLVYVALLAFTAFYLYYICMTRMYVIAFSLSALVIFLCKKRPKNKQIVMVCVAIILLAVLYFSGLIPRFLATFTESSGEYGGSTLARQYSARYFSGVAQDQPIFGLGFLSPKRYENYWIYFGPFGTAYLDDLGIRNMFYHYGALGIGLVVLSLGRMVYLVMRLLTCRDYPRKALVLGLTVFFGCMCVSLCPFDTVRLLGLIFTWSMVEYDAHLYYYLPRKKATETGGESR